MKNLQTSGRRTRAGPNQRSLDINIIQFLQQRHTIEAQDAQPTVQYLNAPENSAEAAAGPTDPS